MGWEEAKRPGGTVWVESKEQAGSTFCLRIPQARDVSDRERLPPWGEAAGTTA